MATGTLYGCPKSFRTQQILIAAKYGGAKLTLCNKFKAGETEKCPDFLKKSPFGKSPLLETSDGHHLFDTNAISCFVAGNTLVGKDANSKAQVHQWLSLAETEFFPAVAGWVFPSVSVMQHNKQAVEEAKCHLMKLLEQLDHFLLPRTFLVGEQLSLADIGVATRLLLAFQHVLEPSIRQKLVNVTRWFETVVHQVEVKSVLGEVRLCEKADQFDAKKFKECQPQETGKKAKEETPKATEAKAPDAGKPKEEKGGKKKKEEAKEEEQNGAEEMDAADEALALEPKKKDPFDDFPKGTLNLEEFKRVYSNNDTLTVAIPWFAEHFDKENFSIWYCEYKYPQELTKVYMSCNLIAGMFQRLEKMRKNAFGSMCLFGTDNNSTISGIWVWKSHKLAFELSDDWKTDYESYSWKELDWTKDETKKMVKEYFAWEGDFGGKKFNQGKVFK